MYASCLSSRTPAFAAVVGQSLSPLLSSSTHSCSAQAPRTATKKASFLFAFRETRKVIWKMGKLAKSTAMGALGFAAFETLGSISHSREIEDIDQDEVRTHYYTEAGVSVTFIVQLKRQYHIYFVFLHSHFLRLIKKANFITVCSNIRDLKGNNDWKKEKFELLRNWLSFHTDKTSKECKIPAKTLCNGKLLINRISRQKLDDDALADKVLLFYWDWSIKVWVYF